MSTSHVRRAARHALLVLCLAGCAPAPAPPVPVAGDPAAAATIEAAAAEPSGADAADFDATRSAVVRTYADIAATVYDDALGSAEALDAAVDAFLADPTEAGLTAAREGWLAAREVYGQSEAFRFSGGPIDDPDRGVEGLLNAWPLDEAYLDYVEGNPTAGLVHAVDAHPVLDEDVLVALNEQGGEQNVATGYHAIEFLLWGQDRSADGPGRRPASDYVAGQGVHAERRRKLLALETDLLAHHLGRVAAAWDADELASYWHDFVADDAASLGRVLAGLAQFAGHELGGERLSVAYETRDQEDEHSCFSDNTHRDFVAGVQGIANLWRGRYGAVEGAGLEALVAAVDPARAAAIGEALVAAEAAVAAIPPPFDQALTGADDGPGRSAILTAITTLETLSAHLGAAAVALGAATADAG